jgi:CarD family transcriptional regulator
MHGAGIIEQIEQKVILGERREYYVLRVPCGDMKIMIPVDKSDDIGVRTVISAQEMDGVLAILRSESTDMSANWNRRYRENTDKLKNRGRQEVAEVLRNLLRTDREKTLSTGEKKMLSSARQILVSEMILASDLDPAEADKLIGSTV